jgi:hypothetical protein
MDSSLTRRPLVFCRLSVLAATGTSDSMRNISNITAPDDSRHHSTSRCSLARCSGFSDSFAAGFAAEVPQARMSSRVRDTNSGCIATG